MPARASAQFTRTVQYCLHSSHDTYRLNGDHQTRAVDGLLKAAAAAAHPSALVRADDHVTSTYNLLYVQERSVQ